MKLEYYLLQTDTRVTPGLLYAARGFLLDKMPVGWTKWHNHDLSAGHNIHRYPKVQYKLWQHRLSLVILESEKTQLFDLAKRFPLEGTLNRRPIRIKLKSIQRIEHDWNLSLKPRWYYSSNFLPMKKDQYEAFKIKCHQLNLASDAPIIEHPELLDFVKNLLYQRIYEQTQSLGTPFDPSLIRLELSPKPIQHGITNYYKNTLFSKFNNLQFSLNFDWPLHLGIGYGTALGFGMLKSSLPPTIEKQNSDNESLFEKSR